MMASIKDNSSISMMTSQFKIFGFILLVLCFSNVFSAETNYYQWLKGHLHNQYNLDSGYFISPEHEDAVVDTLKVTQKWIGNIDKFSVENFPFSKVLKLTITEGIPQFWEINTKIDTQHVNKDDVILITFWLRNISAQAENGLLMVELANNKTPIAPTNREWQQYFIRTKVKNSGTQQLLLQLGTQAQEIEFAGLAILNYGSEIDINRLPQTAIDHYRKPDEAWYTAAYERIAKYRQGKLQVKVVDNYGNPLPNAYVKLNMLEHHFGFGTAIAAWRLASERGNETYQQKVLNLDGHGHGFNRAVLENCLKWGWWEEVTECPTNAKKSINWLVKNNIPVRGHAIIWEDWQNNLNKVMPKRVWQAVEENNSNYIRAATSERISSILGEPGIKGWVTEWDVLNEAVLDNAFVNLLGKDTHREWFTLVKSISPEVKRVVSDTNILACGGLCLGAQTSFYGIITRIGTENFEGIGLQSHINHPLGSPEQIYGVIDGFARAFPNKDILITEFDISIGNEQLAAEYFRDFLITIYSHQAVSDFLMWGFWDLAHWLGDAPLFRPDWSLKPAGEVFVELVFNQWWTNTEGSTNSDGNFFTNGYLGNYEIVASHGGITKTQRITLHQTLFTGKTTTITIQLNNQVQHW